MLYHLKISHLILSPSHNIIVFIISQSLISYSHHLITFIISQSHISSHIRTIAQLISQTSQSQNSQPRSQSKTSQTSQSHNLTSQQSYISSHNISFSCSHNPTTHIAISQSHNSHRNLTISQSHTLHLISPSHHHITSRTLGRRRHTHLLPRSPCFSAPTSQLHDTAHSTDKDARNPAARTTEAICQHAASQTQNSKTSVDKGSFVAT
jgi:hypothetical protein